jgi:branched-chain amino acid transport system ATP-binding protein
VVLAVDDVTLEFEGLRALSGVSFDVPAGALTALVGPNGAGKTSLLNCVSGFYAPTSGRVIFEGATISGQPPHRVAAHGVARIFQFVELFRHMTVLDNILLGRHRHMRAGVVAGSVFWGRARREEAHERRRVEEVIEFLELGGTARSRSPTCRSACRSWSALGGPWPWSRSSCCWTSRRRA